MPEMQKNKQTDYYIALFLRDDNVISVAIW